MTVLEAERLLNLDYHVSKVTMVSESKNYFIFEVAPIASNSKNRPLLHPAGVEKKTGRIVAFNPMHIPLDEIKTIKRVR